MQAQSISAAQPLIASQPSLVVRPLRRDVRKAAVTLASRAAVLAALAAAQVAFPPSGVPRPAVALAAAVVVAAFVGLFLYARNASLVVTPDRLVHTDLLGVARVLDRRDLTGVSGVELALTESVAMRVIEFGAGPRRLWLFPYLWSSEAIEDAAETMRLPIQNHRFGPLSVRLAA